MHKLLAQQLAKATDESGSVDIAKLCGLVTAAYEDFDRDRRRTDRSMSLMFEEIDAVQRNLERTVIERTKELRARESELCAQNTRFDAALSNMSQGLVMFDADARVVICNQRYIAMYGLEADDIRPGRTLRYLLERRTARGTFSGDPEHFVGRLCATIKAGQTTTEFVELDDGRTIAIVSQPMADGGWVATHEDVTERRRAEMKIVHMARHDALTDLPNRVLLRERLSEALLHVERGQRLAVLYIDLDQFKNVNDSLGHPVGDELLRAVAGRLRGCVAETDTICRVGGDEFCIIQTEIDDATDAERLALRIAEAIRAPYDLHGHLAVIDASIGIALAPADGTDATELIKNADMALYGAKADGRGVYKFFEADMDARMKERRTVELALRHAFDNGEFELYYQPMLNLDTGEVRCCEALLRWHHPTRGMVSPAEFIPVAEDIGLIVALGEWVIRRACADAARWPAHVSVSVNLSPTQLVNKGLLPAVLGALAAIAIAARPAGARDHRSRADAEQRGDAQGAASAAFARHPHLDGRFRHRLFVVELSAQLPVRQDQDRPLLHQGSRREFRRRRHRRGGGGIGRQPAHDDDGRRRRDPRAARSRAQARLHRRAGIFLQPAGPGARIDENPRCRGTARQHRRRVSANSRGRRARCYPLSATTWPPSTTMVVPVM